MPPNNRNSTPSPSPKKPHFPPNLGQKPPCLGAAPGDSGGVGALGGHHVAPPQVQPHFVSGEVQLCTLPAERDPGSLIGDKNRDFGYITLCRLNSSIYPFFFPSHSTIFQYFSYIFPHSFSFFSFFFPIPPPFSYFPPFFFPFLPFFPIFSIYFIFSIC